jgi:hypothetical protein
VRIVLYVREEIPGLAPAGAHITIRGADETRPVIVQVTHGTEMLALIRRHLDRVCLVPEHAPSPEVAELLGAVLRTESSGADAQGRPQLMR